LKSVYYEDLQFHPPVMSYSKGRNIFIPLAWSTLSIIN